MSGRETFSVGGSSPARWAVTGHAPRLASPRLLAMGQPGAAFVPIAGLPTAALNLAPDPTVWPTRDQGASMMCVAYAATACFELESQLQPNGEPPRYSAGMLDFMEAEDMSSIAVPDRPEGWQFGGKLFANAVAALRKGALVPFSACPDVLGHGDPSPAALATARASAKTTLHDAVSQRPGGPVIGADAQTIAAHLGAFIVEELKAGRPVGVGFPIYVDAAGRRNWDLAGAGDGTLTFPIAPGPDDHQGGHAVCITGFEPGPGNGAFIFRNSAGGNFARNGAGLAGRGYGRVSVDDTERHCWDFFTLRPVS